MRRPLVVIPTYNERENLASIVGRVRVAVPDASVLVVDDSSPDGTGVLADELAAARRRGARAAPRRQGGARRRLPRRVRLGLAQGYDPIVQLDADGSHLPEQMPSLLAALDGTDPAGEPVDLVIGSRWIPGGSIENWPRHREWLSRGGSAYARWVLQLPTRDATAGYRVFRADALKRIRLDDVHTRGYGFQVDMLWHAREAGLTVVEVPVTFVERVQGRSKMSLGIVVEAMLHRHRLGNLQSAAPQASADEQQRVGDEAFARLTPGADERRVGAEPRGRERRDRAQRAAADRRPVRPERRVDVAEERRPVAADDHGRRVDRRDDDLQCSPDPERGVEPRPAGAVVAVGDPRDEFFEGGGAAVGGGEVREPRALEHDLGRGDGGEASALPAIAAHAAEHDRQVGERRGESVRADERPPARDHGGGDRAVARRGRARRRCREARRARRPLRPRPSTAASTGSGSVGLRLGESRGARHAARRAGRRVRRRGARR